MRIPAPHWYRRNRSWRLHRGIQLLERGANVPPNAAYRRQAGVKRDRKERQRSAGHDAGAGIEPEERNDVYLYDEKEPTEKAAYEGAATAGQRRAAEDGRGN